MSSYDYRNGYDPAFWDDGVRQCETCAAMWYSTDYDKDRCEDCLAEDEQEGENENE